MSRGHAPPFVYFTSSFQSCRPCAQEPVRTNKIPRQVPEQAWYMHPAFSILIGGILPFGAVFIELFFILTSMWLHQARSCWTTVNLSGRSRPTLSGGSARKAKKAGKVSCEGASPVARCSRLGGVRCHVPQPLCCSGVSASLHAPPEGW